MFLFLIVMVVPKFPVPGTQLRLSFIRKTQELHFWFCVLGIIFLQKKSSLLTFKIQYLFANSLVRFKKIIRYKNWKWKYLKCLIFLNLAYLRELNLNLSFNCTKIIERTFKCLYEDRVLDCSLPQSMVLEVNGVGKWEDWNLSGMDDWMGCARNSES